MAAHGNAIAGDGLGDTRSYAASVCPNELRAIFNAGHEPERLMKELQLLALRHGLREKNGVRELVQAAAKAGSYRAIIALAAIDAHEAYAQQYG